MTPLTRSLLATLQATTYGYSLARLERSLGRAVHAALKPLILGGQVESDLGGKVRLTALGRAAARQAMVVRKVAA